MASYLKIDLSEPKWREPLEIALRKLENFAASYDWVTAPDFDRALSALLDMGKTQAYYIYGYLVMAEVIQPWYSKDLLLTEWLVLKLYPGGDINAVPTGLRAIAKDNNCVGVLCNDSTGINIMGNVYAAAGADPLTRAYFMEIKNGRN